MLARRLVTVPAVLLAFSLALALSPALLTLSVLVDLLRPGGRASWSSVRLTLFLLSFLGTETVGLAMLLAVWVSSRGPARVARTYRVQAIYTHLHFRSLRAIFSLRFECEDQALVPPGPMLVLVQHASIIDVLVPAIFVAGINLRYVLKAELLVDPCLDFAGHWLPNHFVVRDGRDSATEIAAVRALKAGLGVGQGVLLFPEGTRFTAARRARALLGPQGAQASELQHLLPLKPGGVLALLDAAPACDVVILGHRGLEGFARLSDIWRGKLVGTTVRLKVWREPASSIPQTDAARLAWLHGHWQRLDRWLEAGAAP
jgi:1-acyl-sn-glycerol-3-phosphate acyltransferase